MTTTEDKRAVEPGYIAALWNAAPEILVILAFASSPFWLGLVAFAMTAEFQGSSWAFASAALSTVSRGELLVFAVTFVAPAAWTVLVDPEGSRKFPGRPYWGTAVSLLLVFASFAFGVWRARAHHADGFSLVVQGTIAVAVAAILLRLVVLAIHNKRMPNLESIMNGPTNSFVAEYARRRGGSNE